MIGIVSRSKIEQVMRIYGHTIEKLVASGKKIVYIQLRKGTNADSYDLSKNIAGGAIIQRGVGFEEAVGDINVCILLLSEHTRDILIHRILNDHEVVTIKLINTTVLGTVAGFAPKKTNLNSAYNIFQRRLDSLIFRLAIKIRFIKEYTYILCASNNDLERQKKIFRKSDVRRIASLPLEKYRDFKLQAAGAYHQKKKQILFIDSDICGHGDQKQLGQVPLDHSIYQKEIISIFEKFEAHLNTDVVIALHPKHNYQNPSEFFGGRVTKNGVGDEDVFYSTLVLFHESSAVLTALIHRKPVIQIYLDRFNSFYTFLCDEVRSSLRCPRVTNHMTDQDLRSITLQPSMAVAVREGDNYLKSVIGTAKDFDSAHDLIIAIASKRAG
jgi:hypothetical protein